MSHSSAPASASPEAGSSDVVFLESAPVMLEMAHPSGEPCPACGSPVEHDEKFCGACGTANPRYVAPSSAPTSGKHLKCDACGAEIETHADQRSYTCPFCDSTYVLEVPATAGRPSPEFVIGFAVSNADAEQKFREWISEKSWFRPSDLAHVRLSERLQGVYLPFWNFAMLAHSRWNATIGEHWYRTETYTVRNSEGKTETRTRQVQETEWWPLSGLHHRYYSGYLVSAAKGLPQAEADSIMPYQLAALKRFEPSYLAGWPAEEASVDREAALEVCRAEFQKQEQANITAFLPGDTHRALSLETRFGDASSDLCLLPVFVMNYRYQGKSYRFLINGQSGRIVGARPYSSTRIAIAVVAAIVAVLVVGAILFGLFAIAGAL